MRIYFISIITIVIILITGCAPDSMSKRELDYEQTKRMVIDILQTDEGKRALREILQDDKMKQQLVLDSDVVNSAITDALTSEDGTEMWQKLFEDPAFVEAFVSSTEEEQEELYKRLMNDAAYQKQFITLLQNPEITDQTLTLLKSQQFREHLEEVIQETIDTPLFQAKMEKVLLKAADKKNEQEQGDSKEDEDDEKEEEKEDDNKDNKSEEEEGSEDGIG